MRALQSHPVLAGEEGNSSRDPTFGCCRGILLSFLFHIAQHVVVCGAGAHPQPTRQQIQVQGMGSTWPPAVPGGAASA